MDLGIVAIFAACTGREAINLSLCNECRIWSYPWLACIQMFEGVLFLVFPFHMLLLVAHRIPPDVEQAICPVASADEEGAEVEAAAVLRDNEINGFGFIITRGRSGYRIEVGGVRRMSDIERVVNVDVAVGVALQIIEYMRLQRIGWLHDKSIEV